MSCASQLAIVTFGHSESALLTAWKVDFPSAKSSVPKSTRLSPLLSPFCQLLASISHSGWKSRHAAQPKRGSSAVRRIETA